MQTLHEGDEQKLVGVDLVGAEGTLIPEEVEVLVLVEAGVLGALQVVDAVVVYGSRLHTPLLKHVYCLQQCFYYLCLVPLDLLHQFILVFVLKPRSLHG